jgi:MoaA/NifB/PqqE/SkfB family radical SAM enzyme
MYEYDGKYVTIMLCSTCNVKCKHCYIKYKGDFKYDEVNSLIDTLQKKYIVMLNGTEPILNKDYYPLFKKLNMKKIMTNGLAILKDPSIVDEIKKYGISEIGMSYHFGIQEELSVVKENQLKKIIKILKDKGIKVKLMTSLSKKNYKNIKNICKEAYDLGACYIKFTNMIRQGNAVNLDEDDILNQEEIDYVLKTIDEERKKYDKDKFTIKRCGSFGPNKNKDNFECLACKNMAIITPDLKVYRCIFDIDKGNEIGYVKDGKIMIYDKFRKEDTSYCEILRKYNKV